LNPTRIYVDPVVDLIMESRGEGGVFPEDSIKAIAHITGGGLSNLLRLHDSLGWHIGEPLSAQPEFEWIAEIGSVNSKEMHRTFNMGMGMVVAVSAAAADPVAYWLEERLSGSRVVGEVVDQGRVVTHSDSGVRFVRY
jgi:phosphoribosylformylglycinamidine cyclo-ligase